jgi:F0F1-type ATP synthase delta subunit
MKISRQHRRTARIIWQESFADGKPDLAAVGQKIKALRDEKSRQREFVLEALMDRIALYLRENRLRISSPDELSGERIKNIMSLIGDSGAFAGGIEFIWDRSLIAGLKIEKGYDIEAYSVSRQLELLRNRLVKN